ncbi:MAG: EamA/RhaT family transporter, partial [Alphaproteobacteria bacterium]|nr:EamA/RhaT family transporter [Alphaproteobacteria bacterium]
MLSLTFGLAAALAWACHDLLVRKLAQDGGILPMLLVVLVGGSVGIALPALAAGGWGAMTGAAFGWAILAGGA